MSLRGNTHTHTFKRDDNSEKRSIILIILFYLEKGNKISSASQIFKAIVTIEKRVCAGNHDIPNMFISDDPHEDELIFADGRNAGVGEHECDDWNGGERHP